MLQTKSGKQQQGVLLLPEYRLVGIPEHQAVSHQFVQLNLGVFVGILEPYHISLPATLVIYAEDPAVKLYMELGQHVVHFKLYRELIIDIEILPGKKPQAPGRYIKQLGFNPLPVAGSNQCFTDDVIASFVLPSFRKIVHNFTPLQSYCQDMNYVSPSTSDPVH
jgi:hypothetical protein